MSRSVTHHLRWPLLALCLVGTGCTLTQGPAARPAEAASGGSEARNERFGLEMMTWIAGDPPPGSQAAVPEAVLRTYAQRRLPFAPDVVRAWNECGIAIVSVPVGDLTRVRERLAMAGPVQGLQLPLSPRWMTGVTSPRSQGSQLVSLDSGLVTVERGQARLLVRAWAAPSPAWQNTQPTVNAVAQVQVVPQITGAAPAGNPTPRTAAELLSGSPGMPTDESAGQLLSRLVLEGSCDGTEAFIFYPLPADADSAEQASTPAPRGIGPDLPEPPSLGEFMLTDALAPRPKRERTLLVLVPHPPREFRLVQ